MVLFHPVEDGVHDVVSGHGTLGGEVVAHAGAVGPVVLAPETGEVVVTNAIYWGALIQACIDFLLTAIILFAIFKVANTITNAAKKAHEKARLALEEKRKEEEPVVEEVAPAEPPKPAEPTIEEKQLALLQSINDNLLKLNATLYSL